jgi:hypothetical protein
VKPDRGQWQAWGPIAAIVATALTLSWMAPIALYLYLSDKAEGQRIGRDPLASFPFEYEANRVRRVAIIWLGMALAAWLWCGWIAWRNRRRRV